MRTHTRDALGRRTALAVDLVTGFDSADWSVDTTTAEHANAYTFDHLDQLTRVTQSGGTSGNAGVAAKRVDLQYDSAGRTTNIKRRDGLLDAATIVAETTNTFVSGMVTKIETKNSSAAVIAKYEYTNDYLRGRVDKLKTGVGAAEHETTYKYDTAGQLVSADDNATTPLDENCTWDLNGNRKNLGDTVATGNQLTTAGALKYVYDAEGNLQEVRTNDANNYLQVAYEWDYRQRMTKVTFKNATGAATTKTVEYSYDTFNRLVSKKVTQYSGGSPQTPVVQYFVHDEETKAAGATLGAGGSMSPSPLAGEGRGEGARGDGILEFLDTDGAGGNAPAVAKRFLWSTAVDQLFAQEDVTKSLAATDRLIWLLQDKLGTVRSALNRDGTVNAVLDYDAFGRLTSITDANGQNLSVPPTYFGFTAQFYDVDTGLVWFSDGTGRGRWFSPVLQRFINRDEPILRDGPNPYAYVHNTPTNAKDPSGQGSRIDSWRGTKDGKPGTYYQRHDWDNPWTNFLFKDNYRIGPIEFIEDIAPGVGAFDTNSQGTECQRGNYRKFQGGQEVAQQAIIGGITTFVVIGSIFLPGPEDVIWEAVAARYGWRLVTHLGRTFFVDSKGHEIAEQAGKQIAEVVDDLIKRRKAVEAGAKVSYDDFPAFKRAMGPAGENRVWHHIVEQRGCNVAKFGAHKLHHQDNIVNITRDANQKLANYYSRARTFTGGKTVRKWLETQSYEDQMKFGADALERVLTGKPLL